MVIIMINAHIYCKVGFIARSIAMVAVTTEQKGTIFDQMQDMLGTKIILIILMIDTIRTILVALGFVHHDTPILGRMLCGRRDKDIVKNVLIDMGYQEKKANASLTDIKNLVNNRLHFPNNDILLKLLDIISQSIIRLDASITYGGEKTSRSNYYINTMGIAHDKDSLEQMEKCLEALIDRHNIKRDFVIVPKGGNPLLAQKLSAERDNIPFIMAKDEKDAARPHGGSTVDLDAINYEGFDILIEKNKDKSRKLKGVLIDCNAAGGGQLYHVVKEFNEFVKVRQYNIEPIKECFVLFKLTKEDSVTGTIEDDDKKFTDIGCKLYRFFDLDEDDKDKIYSSKKRIDETHSGTSNDSEHMKILQEVLKDLANKKRLYWK